MSRKRDEIAARMVEAQRAAVIAKAHETKDPILWAQAVWCIRGDQSRPYSIEGFEFLKEPVRSEAPTVTIMAGAGLGKTELFIPWTLSRADRGRRELYFSENDLKTGLIVQERVNPNFRSSPYLQARNQGEVDNVHLKKLGPGFTYFLGLNTDSASRSYHGDDAVYDEYDAISPARILDGQKRLASATDPFIRNVSNPSQPDYGIHKRYKQGDMRRVHITCECCQKEHPLDISTNVNRKLMTMQCVCGGSLKVIKRRWVPTNPKAEPGHHSYHMHRLLAAKPDIPKLLEALASEDWRTVSAATRMDLGLPYEDKDSGLSDSDLQNAMGSDEWTKRAPGGFVACDPGNLFDIQLWTKGDAGIESKCVWVGHVSGWTELEYFIEESGAMGGIVDYGPDGVASAEFCKRMRARGKWFTRIAYWMSEAPGQPDWKQDAQDPLLLQANRTAVIDTMCLKIRKGQLKFPARVVRDGQGRWAEHMKSPRRVTEFNDAGKAKTRWDHEETRPDHQFHVTTFASVYLEAVARRGGSQAKVLDDGGY